MTTASEFDFSAMATTERLLLAQQLLDSVLTESCALSERDLAEIDRRIADIESGKVVCVPWDEVRQRLRSRFK